MTIDKLLNGRDAKEEAFLYDLYVVPLWREPFDKIIDDEIKLPSEGRFLEVGCGTGNYAIDLSVRGGMKTEVTAIDSSSERLKIARAKAEIQKADRVTFLQSSLTDLKIDTEEFDLVIGDGSLLPVDLTGEFMAELIRVAKSGATIALKFTTRGSFDELSSIFWEALYNLELTQYTPELEALITERLTVSDVEDIAKSAGFKKLKSVSSIEHFNFKDADTFFSSPVVEPFVSDWLNILPDETTKQKVKNQLVTIIDRDRHDGDFDVSIKATVLIGQK